MLDPPKEIAATLSLFVGCLSSASAGSGGKGERLLSYHYSPSRSRSGFVELCQLSVVTEPLKSSKVYCGKVRLAFRNKSYSGAW